MWHNANVCVCVCLVFQVEKEPLSFTGHVARTIHTSGLSPPSEAGLAVGGGCALQPWLLQLPLLELLQAKQLLNKAGISQKRKQSLAIGKW